MKINEANGYQVQAEKYGKAQQTGAGREMDSESKDYQNQIASAQNRLKELAADHEISDEEKKEKRQEIQKKIAELNNQLRQHQMELRREQQAKKERTEELSDKKQEQEQKPEQLMEQEENQTAKPAAQSGVKAVISADTAIRQAKAQGNLARTMEGRVRILQGEIKQDEGRGKNTESKQKELEALEKKAARIAGSQMGILSDAAHEMKRAAETDNRKDSAPKQDQKKVSEKMVNVARGTSSGNKTDIYTRGKTFSTVNIHI